MSRVRVYRCGKSPYRMYGRPLRVAPDAHVEVMVHQPKAIECFLRMRNGGNVTLAYLDPKAAVALIARLETWLADALGAGIEARGGK